MLLNLCLTDSAFQFHLEQIQTNPTVIQYYIVILNVVVRLLIKSFIETKIVNLQI